MSRKFKFSSLGWAAVVGMAAMLFFAACEEDPDIDNIAGSFTDPLQLDSRGELVVGLAVDPTLGTCNFAGDEVPFRAKGGVPPYSWNVSSESKGVMVVNAINSDSAIYHCRIATLNSVLVTDSRGRTIAAQISPRDEQPLAITPEAQTLINPNVGTEVQFAVSGGIPPYDTWTADATFLGTIDQDGLYTVASDTAYGDNIVSITDSAGLLATATVTHELDTQELTIVPSDASLDIDTERATMTAVGGIPDYEWSLAYPDRGEFTTPTIAATVTYRRLTEGDQQITVIDAEGSSATVVISQPSNVLTIGASSTTLGEGTLSVDLEAVGGIPGYQWDIISGPGSLSVYAGPSISYIRTGTDTNTTATIVVTDSAVPAATNSITLTLGLY